MIGIVIVTDPLKFAIGINDWAIFSAFLFKIATR